MIDPLLKPPEALMRAIAADLKPVKPSPRPLRLALLTVPHALVVSSLVLLGIGIRGDSNVLGPLLTWGASAVQFALGIMLVWIAAHETTPAARLPKETVYSVAVAALLVVIATTVSTFSISPLGSTLRVAGAVRVLPAWVMDLACGIGSTVMGGILVLLFSWVFRNSFAIRPTVVGALYGAGAGVAINAGWRIACPFPTLRHALGAHGTAIVATVILGALIGRFLAARRFRSADRKS